MDKQTDAYSNIEMDHLYCTLQNSQSREHSKVEDASCVRKWRPCILGMVIGCVCTFILGLGIGFVVHPYLISKVDGGWGQWITFGSCSVTCGTGLVPIVRRCDNPVPSNNGKNCVGEHYGLGTCIGKQCEDKNLALNKETEQSSTFNNHRVSFKPFWAVDGHLNASKVGAHTCSHTKGDSNAWWAVDLGDLYDIHRVVIYGRTNCCTDRLSNFDIDIFKSRSRTELEFSNFQDGKKSKCHYQPGEVPDHVLNVTCPPGTNGQFVRVQLRGSNFLTLCEVEVYGASRLIEYSDFEFERPYSGPKVTIVTNTTEEQCDTFCSDDSNELDCNASYSRQKNTCTVFGISSTKF